MLLNKMLGMRDTVRFISLFRLKGEAHIEEEGPPLIHEVPPRRYWACQKKESAEDYRFYRSEKAGTYRIQQHARKERACAISRARIMMHAWTRLPRECGAALRAENVRTIFKRKKKHWCSGWILGGKCKIPKQNNPLGGLFCLSGVQRQSYPGQ